MDAAKWPQNFPEVGLGKQMEEVVSTNSNNNNNNRGGKTGGRAAPQEQLNCPRCNSTNTKFCYYNNYSLTQPRYFCKTCRRYWTEGGSLRNVPVGGGSRKNKRSSSSSSPASAPAPAPAPAPALSNNIHNYNNNKLIIPDLNPPSSSLTSHFSVIPSHHHHHHHHHHQNPKIQKQAQDLNLAFQVMHNSNNNNETPSNDHMFQAAGVVSKGADQGSNNNNNSNMSPVSALDLLRTGIANSRGSGGHFDSFIPTPMPPPDSNTLFSSGFSLQDIKPAASASASPTLSFSIDHGINAADQNRFGVGVGVGVGVGENNHNMNGRLFFPFGDQLKQISSAASAEIDHHQINNKGQPPSSNGYWNGMFGGGSW